MRIAGLQKLTLLDFPGKTAATVFTPGCNFRCPFCHNAALVTGEAERDGAAADSMKYVPEAKRSSGQQRPIDRRALRVPRQTPGAARRRVHHRR